MEAKIEALQGVVTTEPDVEVQAELAQPDDAAIETQLTEEITALWSSHLRLSLDRRATSTELRQIRAKLAERLYAIKQLLCRVGCSGQWRSWLKERQIPRSSADRLCERHAETLGIRNQNASDGAIKEEQDTVEKMVQSLLPRLRSKLADTKSVFEFIASLAGAFGLTTETGEDGIMVFLPEPNKGEDSSFPPDAPEEVAAEMASPGTEAPTPDGVAEGCGVAG